MLGNTDADSGCGGCKEESCVCCKFCFVFHDNHFRHSLKKWINLALPSHLLRCRGQSGVTFVLRSLETYLCLPIVFLLYHWRHLSTHLPIVLDRLHGACMLSKNIISTVQSHSLCHTCTQGLVLIHYSYQRAPLPMIPQTNRNTGWAKHFVSSFVMTTVSIVSSLPTSLLSWRSSQPDTDP